jgi:GNAT superfamily N-acetyltransferase
MAEHWRICAIGQIHPELGAAHALLGKLKRTDTLAYEPRLGNTKKSIDFLVRAADGGRGWIDVKTVAPPWLDNDEGWKLYAKVAAEFKKARLVVDREFSGAGIGSQAIKARYSFITRTVELEQKIALIPQEEAGKVWLLLCGDRSSWHLDDLEDFADFYRAGSFRADDWGSEEAAHFMKKKDLAFSRVLSGFHYVGRRHDEIETDLRLGVRGPALFSPGGPPSSV